MRISKRMAGVALAAVVAFAGSGCGKSPKDEAASLLAAGLKAHTAGKLDEALADYRKVLEIDPKNHFAFYNIGLIAQTQGRTGEAEFNYRQAIALKPDYTPALYNLALVRAEAGSRAEAVELYRKVIAVNDADASAHFNLGLLLVQMGQVPAGTAELRKAFKLNPELAARVPTDVAKKTAKPLPRRSPTATPR